MNQAAPNKEGSATCAHVLMRTHAAAAAAAQAGMRARVSACGLVNHGHKVSSRLVMLNIPAVHKLQLQGSRGRGGTQAGARWSTSGGARHCMRHWNQLQRRVCSSCLQPPT